jgi:hypothetical protein
MATKGKQRKRLAAAKARKKSADYLKGGNKSRYARKVAWLRSNTDEHGRVPWGFQVAHKPWR